MPLFLVLPRRGDFIPGKKQAHTRDGKDCLFLSSKIGIDDFFKRLVFDLQFLYSQPVDR